jgi:thiol-disulfide isomerase/thioredoxin
MAGASRKRSGLALLAIAAVAGLVAGTVAVYVRGSGNSNAAAAGCDLALAASARAEPLARGEVAAFRVASRPENLAGLAFVSPEGQPAKLADFSGKAVLLNLWATWCVPCREEMPALDHLEAELGGDDFTVVAVNVDVRNRERARAFLDDIGVSNLAFYSDPNLAVFNDLKRRGHALGLPSTILVDGKGCVIGGIEGPAVWDSEDAKSLIRAAIGKA